MSQRAMIPNPQPGESGALFRRLVFAHIQTLVLAGSYKSSLSAGCKHGGDHAVSWCWNDLKRRTSLTRELEMRHSSKLHSA